MKVPGTEKTVQEQCGIINSADFALELRAQLAEMHGTLTTLGMDVDGFVFKCFDIPCVCDLLVIAEVPVFSIRAGNPGGSPTGPNTGVPSDQPLFAWYIPEQMVLGSPTPAVPEG